MTVDPVYMAPAQAATTTITNTIQWLTTIAGPLVADAARERLMDAVAAIEELDMQAEQLTAALLDAQAEQGNA